MNEIKQASIYLRVLWINDNENVRPDIINIELTEKVIEPVSFSISQNNNFVGNSAPWEANEWVNGIIYNYQNEPIENEDGEEIISEIPYVIPSVSNVPTNYRCNILKNAETAEYAYYTVKMTYVAPKPRRLAKSGTRAPTINFNGITIENVNFNGIELDKVVFNGTTVFEKKNNLFKDIILANSVVNEGTPDFSLTATTDEGVFITEDNDGLSYYFRGAVLNNWVKLGNMYFRIIRINGDGSIRLIYSGENYPQITGSEAVINNNGTISFNYNDIEKNSCVGYMYGDYDATTYEETHSNLNSSIIKEQLDIWFKNNLINYSEVIDYNSGFYNDRSVTYGNGIGKNLTNYGSYNRLKNNKMPSLKYSQNDLFTTIKSDKGNKALLYPVGSITADECAFLGGVFNETNSNYWLYINFGYWTISPSNYEGFFAKVFSIDAVGKIIAGSIRAKKGIRPVINLKADIQIEPSANDDLHGTINNPYVVVI